MSTPRQPTPFALLEQVVKGLGKALGDRCEIVLHDLRSPESSIIAIEHGEITGREVGDPSTNLALPVLKDPYGEHDAFNYRSRTRDGRVLKSSTIHLKDQRGRIFAAICINWDITELEAAAQVLRSWVETGESMNEEYVRDVDELVSHFVEEALQAVGKPVQAMTKEDKMRVLRWLEDRGVFKVKHAVGRVAALLGLSRVTVYAYLNEMAGLRASQIVGHDS